MQIKQRLFSFSICWVFFLLVGFFFFYPNVIFASQFENSGNKYRFGRIRLPNLNFNGIHKPIADIKIESAFLNKSRFTLIVKDSLGNSGVINGFYPIEINGFERNLFFLSGKSHLPGNLKSSTFLLLKVLNRPNNLIFCFFLYQWAGEIYPLKVSMFWIIGVPVMVLLISFFFRKLILLLIVLIALFFFDQQGFRF